jgi:two-component system response regulator WspF
MKIAIVNAKPRVARTLRDLASRQPGCQVLWTAHDGPEAVRLCAERRPDLVLMDLILPRLSGVEATRQIMTHTPCPILIVSEDLRRQATSVWEAMGHGALDAIDTPAPGATDESARTAAFFAKIDSIAKRIDGGHDTLRTARLVFAAPRATEERLIVIGASAGGPAALAKLLAALPREFPAAIVIVQHLNAEFAAGLAGWLNNESALPVQIVEPGARPTTGRVLVAATNDHLILTAAGRLDYTREPSDYAYRPSVDVFFRSVREFWPFKTVGVLLTGMGRDGAVGLKALRDAGSHTIAQDKATSAVYGMPKAASILDAAVDILPIGEIAPRLVRLMS